MGRSYHSNFDFKLKCIEIGNASHPLEALNLVLKIWLRKNCLTLKVLTFIKFEACCLMRHIFASLSCIRSFLLHPMNLLRSFIKHVRHIGIGENCRPFDNHIFINMSECFMIEFSLWLLIFWLFKFGISPNEFSIC